MRSVTTPARDHDPPACLAEPMMVAEAPGAVSQNGPLDSRQKHARARRRDVLDGDPLVRPRWHQGAADRRLSGNRGRDAADVRERGGLTEPRSLGRHAAVLELAEDLDDATRTLGQKRAPALVQPQAQRLLEARWMRKWRESWPRTLAYGGGDLQ